MKTSKTLNFKYAITTVTVALSLLATAPAQAGSPSERQQAKLDAACEAAREKTLAPLRAGYVEECVEKEQRADRAACERFYADYGNHSGRRAALFYDLPECVEAFEYRLDTTLDP